MTNFEFVARRLMLCSSLALVFLLFFCFLLSPLVPWISIFGFLSCCVFLVGGGSGALSHGAVFQVVV